MARVDGTGLCIGTTLGIDVGANTSDGNVITRLDHGTLSNGGSTGAAAETATASPLTSGI